VLKKPSRPWPNCLKPASTKCKPGRPGVISLPIEPRALAHLASHSGIRFADTKFDFDFTPSSLPRRGCLTFARRRTAQDRPVTLSATRRNACGLMSYCRITDVRCDRRLPFMGASGTIPLRWSLPRITQPAPPRPHHLVQERIVRHEKRNAHQRLAAGGMPDRDR
jgi:hypothetical protein